MTHNAGTTEQRAERTWEFPVQMPASPLLAVTSHKSLSSSEPHSLQLQKDGGGDSNSPWQRRGKT